MPNEEPKIDPYKAWELSLLALTIWREARNQTNLGMLAVAWSIRNRVMDPKKNWWGNDWEEVMLMRWQYTSHEKSDPNAYKLPGDPNKDTSWSVALDVARKAYYGIGVDPTNGATHYYNPKVVAKPSWVDGAEYKGVFGDHYFYKAA